MDLDLKKQLEKETKARQALINAYFSLSEANSLEEIFEKILLIAEDLTSSEGSSLLLIDSSTGNLKFVAATGEKKDDLIGLEVPVGKGIAGWIAANNEPSIVSQTQSDSRFYKKIDQKVNFTTRNLLGVPLRLRGKKVIGVLEVVNKIDGEYTDWDVEILLAFGGLAATVIENARLQNKILSLINNAPIGMALVPKNENDLENATVNDYFKNFLSSSEDKVFLNRLFSEMKESSQYIFELFRLKPTPAFFKIQKINMPEEDEYLFILSNEYDKKKSFQVFLKFSNYLASVYEKKLISMDKKQIEFYLKKLKIFLRSVAGPLRLHRQNLKLNEFLDNFNREIKDYLNEWVSLNINKNFEIENVYVDIEMLNLVLTELVLNAARLITNKEVNLRIFEDKDNIYFTVENDISEENLDFSYLNRELNQISMLELATQKGMGLIVVKKIVEAHGGILEVNRLTDNRISFKVSFKKLEEGMNL